MKSSKRFLSGIVALVMILAIVTVSRPAAADRTEVINPSTDCCGDDWSWTGDSDKIATLPYGEITADEIYVAAI